MDLRSATASDPDGRDEHPRWSSEGQPAVFAWIRGEGADLWLLRSVVPPVAGFVHWQVAIRVLQWQVRYWVLLGPPYLVWLFLSVFNLLVLAAVSILVWSARERGAIGAAEPKTHA